MASWLLILVGAAVLVVVVALVALVWVLSGRAKPGGVINPNNDPGVQAAHAQSQRHIQNNFGDPGPSI